MSMTRICFRHKW